MSKSIILVVGNVNPSVASEVSETGVYRGI